MPEKGGNILSQWPKKNIKEGMKSCSSCVCFSLLKFEYGFCIVLHLTGKRWGTVAENQRGRHLLPLSSFFFLLVLHCPHFELNRRLLEGTGKASGGRINGGRGARSASRFICAPRVRNRCPFIALDCLCYWASQLK